MRYRITCSLLAAALLLGAADAEAQDCRVTFALDSAVTAGALQFAVSYPFPNVDFTGSGPAVSCTDLTGSLPTFQDDDAGTLSSVLVSFGGITGPRDVLTCDLTYSTLPIAGDFGITVTDATAPDLTPIVPIPTMSVSNLSCTGSTTTTTTSPGGGSTSTTSTTLPSQPLCAIDFDLVDAVSLGSLGYSVDYSPADGDFEGGGGAVTCMNLVPGGFTSFNDDEGARNLHTAIIHLGGFDGPLTLASCTFVPGAVDPVAGDFSVTVTDASEPSLTPVSPLPEVRIGAINCFDPSVTTTLPPTTTTTSTTTTTVAVCGDGVMQAGEECDDGPANSDTLADACRTDCRLPVCGDAVVDSGEECDDGAANSNSDPNTCRSDCTVEYVCGDADGSGSVNVTDAARILQVAVGLISGCAPGRCDVTGDGRVSVSDGQRVLAHFVGLPATLNCTRAVVLRLDDAVALGSLSLTVDYAASGSWFSGEGAAVSCTNLLPGASSSFDNDSAASELTVGLTVATGFTGPVDLVSCVLLQRDDAAQAADFNVTVTGASAPDAQPVVPFPALSALF